MTERTGITLGGDRGGTLGGERGGTLGHQSPQEFHARLSTDSGQVIDIPDVLGLSLTKTHTAVSDISMTVPRRPGMEDFGLGRLELRYGDDLLWKGRARKLPGPGQGIETTLSGPGIEWELTRGEITVSYDGSTGNWSDAIADVWETHTDFQAQVFTPSSPTAIPDTWEKTGTPMQVLSSLHELAGMRFTVLHGQPGKVVESYVPSERTRTGTWAAVDSDSTWDFSGYAYEVIVRGKLRDDGTRPRATALDSVEESAFGADVPPWVITDPELTSDAQCQARADEELAARTAADQFDGSIEIIPELVEPGYVYEIPQWVVDGAALELPINEVSYSISLGEASATLSAGSDKGLGHLIAQAVNDQRTNELVL